MKKFSVSTSGTGLWSKTIKPVTITKVEIETDPEIDHLVSVYFDTKTWNPKQDGLIYSDEPFLESLRKHLMSDPDWKSVRDWSQLVYTEQGMQGKDFISLEFLD